MASLLRLRSVFGRSSTSMLNTAAALTVRGPKKKGKQAKVETPDNPDIVNIFKGGADAHVYPSDMYPPYVMRLLETKYTPDEIMLQMYRGERMPSAQEQWTLSNAVFRLAIKDRNVLTTVHLQHNFIRSVFGLE